MKDEVEFADIFKTLVECFDEDLDEVEDSKLGLRTVYAEDEVESCVVAIDQLVVWPANQTERN